MAMKKMERQGLGKLHFSFALLQIHIVLKTGQFSAME